MHRRQSENLIQILQEAQQAEDKRQQRLSGIRDAQKRRCLERRYEKEREMDATRVKRAVEDNMTLVDAYRRDMSNGGPMAFIEADRARFRMSAEERSLANRAKHLATVKKLEKETSTQMQFYKECFNKMENEGSRKAERRAKQRATQQTQCARLAYKYQRRDARPSKPTVSAAAQRAALLREKAAILDQIHELTTQEQAIDSDAGSFRPRSECGRSQASYATFGSRSSSRRSSKPRTAVPRLNLV